MSGPPGTAPTTTVGAVWEALRAVRDPELDTDIVTLEFVGSCALDDGVATITLRLPTYFCAPNFAFLMVADAHDAVSALPAITRADVTLIDHFASDAINAGVAARAGATAEHIATMTVTDAPPGPELTRLLARRAELGLPAGPDAPLVIDPSGHTVGIDALPLHLRKARSYQVGVDANTSICRGQLAARYGP